MRQAGLTSTGIVDIDAAKYGVQARWRKTMSNSILAWCAVQHMLRVLFGVCEHLCIYSVIGVTNSNSETL